MIFLETKGNNSGSHKMTWIIRHFDVQHCVLSSLTFHLKLLEIGAKYPK